MQYGLNENNERVLAEFTGQRSNCPMCGTTLIASCGELYINHWKHDRYQSCDAWFEPETLWHREWKANFPKEWQEVIIVGPDPFYEKHIADIRTDNGFVLEFQNSSISTTEIRIREHFYKDMAWVINAESFADNFKIRSIVNSELREVDRSILFKVEAFERVLKEQLDDNERELNIEKNGLSRIKSERAFKVEERDEVLKIIAEKDKHISQLMEVHFGKAYRYRNPFFQVYESLEPDLYTKLAQMETKLVELNEEIKNNENKIAVINLLKPIIVDGIQYKEVSHSNISQSTFKFAGAINRKEALLMFPEVVRFDTFEYFEAFKTKSNLYIFFIDPHPFLKNYNENLEKVKGLLDRVELSILNEKQLLQIEIEKQLGSHLKKIEEEILNLDNKILSLSNKVTNLESSLKRNKVQKSVKLTTPRRFKLTT